MLLAVGSYQLGLFQQRTNFLICDCWEAAIPAANAKEVLRGEEAHQRIDLRCQLLTGRDRGNRNRNNDVCRVLSSQSSKGYLHSHAACHAIFHQNDGPPAYIMIQAMTVIELLAAGYSRCSLAMNRRVIGSGRFNASAIALFRENMPLLAIGPSESS